MATRIRARAASIGPSTSGSDAQHSTAGKRRRDVLQDISEEHYVNGEAMRQKQQSSAGSSRRASMPSSIPMAPARRVSLRRSRRLSEQQPPASGRAGATGAATSGGGSSSGGSLGIRESDEEDNAGMSCDEDLEGTIVDLSFECVSDDPYTSTLWRDSRSRPSCPSIEHSRDTEEASGKAKTAARERAGESGERGNSGSGANNGSEATRVRRVADRKGGRVRDRLRAGGSGDQDRDAERLVCVDQEPEIKIEDGDRGGTGGGVGGALRTSAAGVGSRSRDDCREGLQADLKNLASSVTGSDESVTSQCPQTPSRATREPGVRDQGKRPSLGGVAAASSRTGALRTPLPGGVEDIDAGLWEEGDCHLLNPDYVVEHAAFLRVQEKRNRPGSYIESRQKEMRPSMRSVLVDWIVEVCDQFKLSSRTLFQVVELIDRSLTAFEVPRAKLQLLGCACVVLASKYEEIYAPTAEELAHISDNTYTRAEIISMELTVVNGLHFRLTCVTPCNFVDRFCRAARSKPREHSLVAYLLELLLQDYYGVTVLPSLKAAAALYLARQTLHPKGCPREAWTKQTEYYTGYSARALEPCVRRLHALHLRAEGNNLHSVRDKYKKPQMHRVAEATCALEENLCFGEEACD